MQNITARTTEGHGPAVGEHAPLRRPAPKWAALVDDRVIPMPRRVVSVQVIRDQAEIRREFAVVRKYQSRSDVVLKNDAEVDLGEGNVFRTVPAREEVSAGSCSEPAKLAYVVDDEWEVVVDPRQTGQTLRRLFELPPDVELLRDYESPHDEPIADDEAATFSDGPVFRTQRVLITIKVNKNEVKFKKRRVTGLEVKETAIKQGVKIELGFVLYRIKRDGGLGPAIGDSERVVLHECEEFRCVTPDDNS